MIDVSAVDKVPNEHAFLRGALHGREKMHERRAVVPACKLAQRIASGW